MDTALFTEADMFHFIGEGESNLIYFRNGRSVLVRCLEAGLLDIRCTFDLFHEGHSTSRIMTCSKRINLKALIEALSCYHDCGRSAKVFNISSTQYDELAEKIKNNDLTIEINTMENFVNNNYETDNLYCGIHCYHSHNYSSLNKPKKSYKYRVGVEMEVEFNDCDDREDFADFESNWFYRENDGSLNDEGVEIITVPLVPEDAKDVAFWSPLTSYLHGKAVAWDSSNCGLHVHFGREILGDDEDKIQYNLGKLLYLYHHHVKDTRFNIGVFGRERCYSEHDGKTNIGNAVSVLGKESLKQKEVAKRVGDAMKNKSSECRYFDINITNSKTIEFRKGRGTINPKRVVMLVEYCELLCKYAKKTAWASMTYEGFISYLKKQAKSEMLIQLLNQYHQ